MILCRDRDFVQLSYNPEVLPKHVRATAQPHALEQRKFLATISRGRKVVALPEKQIIFTQGDTADAVFYIQQGKVRLTVVSKTGKEATIGILGE